MKRFSLATCLIATCLFTMACGPDDDVAAVGDATTVAIDMGEADHGDDDHDHADGDHDHDHGDHDHGDHDHADHDHDSLTLDTVLATLQAQQAKIQTAFADGEPDSSHDAMHEIGHTINDLKIAAKNEGYGEEQINAVTVAAEELMDAFGALDEGMHGGDKFEYSEFETEIDEAMLSLQTIAEAKPAETKPAE